MTPTATLSPLKNVKLIFFGSGDFAVSILKALTTLTWVKEIVVVTQPDQPAGRHGKKQSTPIKRLAHVFNIPVQEALPTAEQIARSDVGIVVDYGKIIPMTTIHSWPLGILNVHPSLLPQYRGPAPIQRSVLHGQTVTGVSIIRIDRGVDTGPLLAQQSLTIDIADTSITLEKKLATIGARLLLSVLPHYLTGILQPWPQPTTGASYAQKLTRTDGKLLVTDSPLEVWNKYRALQPWPGIYFECRGRRFKIQDMSWSNDHPIVHTVQPAGKQVLTATDFRRGYPAVSFSHIL